MNVFLEMTISLFIKYTKQIFSVKLYKNKEFEGNIKFLHFGFYLTFFITEYVI